jgi:hypothetical protein
MPLAGRKLLPREIAQLNASHWRDVELAKSVAVCLGESGGTIGAWHDNLDEHDEIQSRDLGLMQINIPARGIGGPLEASLRYEGHDGPTSIKVARANVTAAYHLYEQPWTGRSIRRWQPWVAYTTGWATFPEFWIWHQIEGKPVGPWIPTGRYLQQAICGVANWHLWLKKDKTLAEATGLAASHAAHFGVRAELTTRRGYLAFVTPPRPTLPPADGIGPRPRPNDGL